MAQKQKDGKYKKEFAPAITPEGRENELISLAVDLAEQQLREGTASSQVISHFLKLGSEKGRIEKEILEKQKDLIVAKTKAINDSERLDTLYSEAIKAMRSYSGMRAYDDEEDL